MSELKEVNSKQVTGWLWMHLVENLPWSGKGWQWMARDYSGQCTWQIQIPHQAIQRRIDFHHHQQVVQMNTWTWSTLTSHKPCSQLILTELLSFFSLYFLYYPSLGRRGWLPVNQWQYLAVKLMKYFSVHKIYSNMEKSWTDQTSTWRVVNVERMENV